MSQNATASQKKHQDTIEANNIVGTIALMKCIL